MESIIKVVEGKEFKEGKCYFCETKASTVFGTIDSSKNKYNGSVFKGFHICKKHVGALNTLLAGENDIDELVNQFVQNKDTRIKFNLRN